MTSSLVPSLIAFLGVIALIPVALGVMKRAPSLRPRPLCEILMHSLRLLMVSQSPSQPWRHR